jgi:nitrate reductase NapE component
MRVIKQIDSGKEATDKDLEHRKLLVLNIPFRLLREKFLFSLTVKRSIEMENGRPLFSPKRWIRGLNISIMIIIFDILIVVFLAGVGFISYILKCLLGLDIFPFDHLF